MLLQAQLLKREGQYERALYFYEQVKMKCSLQVSVYIEMSQCYHELGNIAESKRVLFLASQVDSDKKDVLVLLRDYEERIDVQ